jgi:hypothetical protein
MHQIPALVQPRRLLLAGTATPSKCGKGQFQLLAYQPQTIQLSIGHKSANAYSMAFDGIKALVALMQGHQRNSIVISRAGGMGSNVTRKAHYQHIVS